MDIKWKFQHIDLPLLTERIKKASKDPLMKAGLLVQRQAQISMKDGGGSRHEPSTPPNPPHVQTGTLRSSISTALTEKLTVIVGPDRGALYGKKHEKGSDVGGRHYPARPFMKPALLKCMDKFPKLFESLNMKKD